MAQVEEGIGEKIPKGADVVTWMVRWAGELISKYSPGRDGKTPYERIRGERCRVPLAMFGETVLYLPLKTATIFKQEGGGMVMGQEEAAGKQNENVEELKERIKDLEDTLVEHWEYNNKEDDKKTPILKVPAKPTEQERMEHWNSHPREQGRI